MNLGNSIFCSSEIVSSTDVDPSCNLDLIPNYSMSSESQNDTLSFTVPFLVKSGMDEFPELPHRFLNVACLMMPAG